jgi:hypothetical protein
MEITSAFRICTYFYSIVYSCRDMTALFKITQKTQSLDINHKYLTI